MILLVLGDIFLLTDMVHKNVNHFSQEDHFEIFLTISITKDSPYARIVVQIWHDRCRTEH